MKIVSALMISVILFSVASFTGCAAPESNDTIRFYGHHGASPMGIQGRNVVTATVKRGDTPVPEVQVCFAITEGPHYPPNLGEGESYEREVCEWGEAAMHQTEYFRPLIAEHWKKEKVYSNSSNYVYCTTGGDNGEAKFAYTGIKPGTDTIVLSATVDGHEFEETVTITWLAPENMCVLDLINNTLSPTNDVVTPVEPLGNGNAVVEIDMGAGNYSVLEMKVEIQDPLGDWLLNIGNSPTNDGAGGDAGSFSNDSELNIAHNTSSSNAWDCPLQVYENGYAQPPSTVWAALPSFFKAPTVPWSYTLRVKIADQKVCVYVVDTGQLLGNVDNPDPECPYIFRLGGTDNENSPTYLNDYIYYAAFNRVISGRPDRTGSGVTKVTFMWRTTWPGWEI